LSISRSTQDQRGANDNSISRQQGNVVEPPPPKMSVQSAVN